MTKRFHRRRRLPGGIARLAVLASGMVAGFGSSFAQESERVTIDARRCMELPSPDERLACFEAQVDGAAGGATAEPAPRAPSPADAPARGAERATRAGGATDTARQDGRAAAPRDGDSAGTIAGLEQRAPNQYVITLDNGQVWQQRGAARYPLRVGQAVRIYSSRWGSSQRLEAEGLNGFIQVDRVR